MAMIENDVIKGKWLEIKGKIRKQWGELTDDEVAKMKGSYEELVGTLQKKYGYQKTRAEKEINDFIRHHELKD